MYIDKQLEFSDEQAVTASAASTDVIDFGSKKRVAVGDKKYIAVTVKEAAAAAGAATVTFKLQGDDAENFGSAVDVFSSAAIGKADLVVGYQFYIEVPLSFNYRYMRMYYTVATGPLTAGKFDAHFVEDIHQNDIYPDAL